MCRNALLILFYYSVVNTLLDALCLHLSNYMLEINKLEIAMAHCSQPFIPCSCYWDGFKRKTNTNRTIRVMLTKLLNFKHIKDYNRLIFYYKFKDELIKLDHLIVRLVRDVHRKPLSYTVQIENRTLYTIYGEQSVNSLAVSMSINQVCDSTVSISRLKLVENPNSMG